MEILIREQFATYEISKIAKEKGFSEPCLGFFNGGKEFLEPTIIDDFDNFKELSDLFVKAPLWQQLIEWFRTHHKISIEIVVNWTDTKNYDGYCASIQSLELVNETPTLVHDSIHSTYEEAREATILKAFELI